MKKSKKRAFWQAFCVALCFLVGLGSCTTTPGGEESRLVPNGPSSIEESFISESQPNDTQPAKSQPDKGEETDMSTSVFYVTVNGVTFTAVFAENVGAQALKEKLEKGPVTIHMDDYGGFEKVGSLGESFPTANSQTTTKAGDIVLYQGNQIVMFYGSNAWSYTRLGYVEDQKGWKEALGNGSVSVTFSLTEKP